MYISIYYSPSKNEVQLVNIFDNESSIQTRGKTFGPLNLDFTTYALANSDFQFIGNFKE